MDKSVVKYCYYVVLPVPMPTICILNMCVKKCKCCGRIPVEGGFLRFFACKGRTGVASPLVWGGHGHIAINLPREVTAEREARAFWVVREHGPQKVSAFLGPWNGIPCIFKVTLPSSDLAVLQESTPDTVSENTCVAHLVYKL